jgi:sugar O-acyltransferase (sialic acid O-acetyltransferase NeuD family)
METLIIVGAGGAGLEALWVAQRINSHARELAWDIIGFADDILATGTVVEDIRVIGSQDFLRRRFAGSAVRFHCSIGENTLRRRFATEWEEAGFAPASLVDPSAVIAPSAQVGLGSYIAPLAFVGPQAVVGRHVIVNTGASVGHHARIGEFAQICPGARLSGKSKLGALGFVGSNGILAPGVNVGDAASIGAGSFAARDVPSGASALGIPAKVLAVPARPS